MTGTTWFTPRRAVLAAGSATVIGSVPAVLLARLAAESLGTVVFWPPAVLTALILGFALAGWAAAGLGRPARATGLALVSLSVTGFVVAVVAGVAALVGLLTLLGA